MKCKKIYFDKNFHILVKEYFDSEFVYVYILQHILSDERYSNDIIIKDTKDQEVKFETDSDGFYVLITIPVPIDETNYYYYKNGRFYNGTKEISITDILKTNPHLSNIVPKYDYCFLTARLKKCYIDACYKIFSSSDRCSKDKTDTYERDLIWSALKTIEYLIEFDQYKEAQRLLEELTSCNGICQGGYTKRCKCHE